MSRYQVCKTEILIVMHSPYLSDCSLLSTGGRSSSLETICSFWVFGSKPFTPQSHGRADWAGWWWLAGLSLPVSPACAQQLLRLCQESTRGFCTESLFLQQRAFQICCGIKHLPNIATEQLPHLVFLLFLPCGCGSCQWCSLLTLNLVSPFTCRLPVVVLHCQASYSYVPAPSGSTSGL